VTLTLYAIVPRRPPGSLGLGVGRAPLSAVRAAGAHVVVERAAPTAPTAATIRGHDRVVRRLARLSPAVLPFRFGSAAADARALQELLSPLEGAIARALAEVDGCVQMTMRVFGEAAKTPVPVSLGDGPGARWLAARVHAAKAPEIAPITRAVAPFVRRTRIERHDREPLLASVYLLVPRADLPRFRAALRRGAAELEGVRIETSGPWAPYAFAELP
jgi:hypothetical protein